MIKKVVKAIIPYGVLWLIRKIRKAFSESEPKPLENPPLPEKPSVTALFNGNDTMFKSLLQKANVYGEYGCGESTQWVLENTKTQVLTVDTSLQWIDEVKQGLDDEKMKRVQIKHVDLGDLMIWGRPNSYDKRDKFSHYTDWIWQQSVKPDTVLIDGRFRVCSFLTSLKFANEGTKLIFDDYTDRPFYQIIEQFLPREEVCGRQCLFIVPNRNKIDLESIETEIINFRHVLE
ncbi:MAG: hypothetical protein AAGJ37_02015 [Pseudomonadota bacterium]